jgi:hypothetical protein
VSTCQKDDSDEKAMKNGLFALFMAGVFTNYCGDPVIYQPGAHSIQIEQGVYHWFDFTKNTSSSGTEFSISLTEATGQNISVRTMACSSGQHLPLVNNTATGQVENVTLTGFDGDSSTHFFYCFEGCSNAFQFSIP